MNQYMLFIIQPVGPAPPPEVLGPIMRDVAAVRAELEAAGALVLTDGLAPPNESTVVRAGAGGDSVVDGPYAETKEVVGGFVIVRAPDREAALAWARKLARAVTLPIEVRPLIHGGA